MKKDKGMVLGVAVDDAPGKTAWSRVLRLQFCWSL
jgi:hypothetical protein